MTAEAQMKELSAIEQSKTSDFLFGEYGFGINELMGLSNKYKLE